MLRASTGNHTQNVQPAAVHLEWILKDIVTSQAPFDAVTFVNNRHNITDEIGWNVTSTYQTDERHIPLYGTQSVVKYNEANEKCFKEIIPGKI